MVEVIQLKEQKPFPNNSLSLLYYPKALQEILTEEFSAEAVRALFASNLYGNSWINGIYEHHHFHSTAHEVLGCIAGESTVQFGGPLGVTLIFSQGDVVLIPAGVSHKLLKQTADFSVLGAYPDGQLHDMQEGNASNYQQIKNNIKNVPLPKRDPVYGNEGPLQQMWYHV